MATSDYLDRFSVSDKARALYNIKKGMYYKGQKITQVLDIRTSEDMLTLNLRVFVLLELDNSEWYRVKCTDDEQPTDVVPRKYRNHVNLQKLEDNYHER